jgi:soluble lytic murein transglycosylase
MAYGAACLAVPLFLTAGTAFAELQSGTQSERERFTRAWQAAARGDRAIYRQLMPGLEDYLLYPYLQYEYLRYRRANTPDAEMSGFLDAHRGWAFTEGLRKAWLKTLGERKRWDSVLQYAAGVDDTEVRCHLAHARIARGQTTDLLREAQALWTVGKSQPDACDPVFSWLKKEGGITPGLAWERIRLAMEARQPRLTLYLARFVPSNERIWVERWQEQDRGGYRRLDRARQWPDQEKSRLITSYGLRRLARNDADRAWHIFEELDGKFAWSADDRAVVLREIALWSAVAGLAGTPRRMRTVPESARAGTLLEWWVRHGLATANWGEVILAVAEMPDELKNDSRWRYWDARARMEMGDPDYANALLNDLALEASYYGFLAADYLDRPYTLCPQPPAVVQNDVDALRNSAGFDRAIELRRAGIRNWSRSEWQLAVRRLDQEGLRNAAALAVEESWPDMAIFALGNSGDLRWYEWRFPVEFSALVDSHARSKNLDESWVMGLIRSESAMAVDALSSAGARGLMQLMPDTAQRLAKRHSYKYTGKYQLMQAPDNVLFGTAYLRELLDRFDQNPVLATGAYNAGPGAVDRWLDSQPASEPAIWVETLPYFETRDYIPRVLAFSTIYDWRRQQPVLRVSSRMPSFDSVNMIAKPQNRETAEIVCLASG